MDSATSSHAAAAPAGAEADPRHTITLLLKGPIADKLRNLVPALAQTEDTYKTVIGSPELLSAALMIFRKRRDLFAEWLVDAEGKPVDRDDVTLLCGRTVDEVIGMVVRTGMRAYAEAHFGDPITPPKRKAPPAPAAAEPKGMLGKVLDMMHLNNNGQAASQPTASAPQTRSGRFYASIKDHLDFEWQIKFFPIYVTIPPHVYEKLGIGITRMDTEERLRSLGQLAVADITKAEQAIGDPALVREMIDHNVLAAKAVSRMGSAGFETIHGALVNADLNEQQKWDVFANHDTAMMLTEDKRISAKDIQALADYLHILNQQALDAMLDLALGRDQMQIFLRVAEEKLGASLFQQIFGPQPAHMADDPLQAEKQKRLKRFTDTTLRGLVIAIKQLRERDADQSIEECLSYVCAARRPDYEKEIKAIEKLTVAQLTAA